MAAKSISVWLLSVFAASSPDFVAAKGFLVERRSSTRGRWGTMTLEEELNIALGEAMGCGGHVPGERLVAIEKQLLPIWSTLPKNSIGHIERRSLRYLMHRHFSRQSALQIRGFEPSRPANVTGWGDADILAQRVPAFVEAFLESGHKAVNGFNLADAARLVATIEQLVFDFEGSVLEKTFTDLNFPPAASYDGMAAERLMEAYMLRWMLGEDEEGIAHLSRNKSMLEETIPHWDHIVAFGQGQVKALEYKRQRHPALAKKESPEGHSHNALEGSYTFEDMHSMVGGITRSFAHFWDSECRAMKAQLVTMDNHHTGRVPISKFYSHSLDSEWRFGESEEYLRDLGALDETSWRGKQVIIPNYLQASSNCIVSSQYYLVCCVNDCEAILDDIEGRIRAPTATPAEILAVVRNVSTHYASLDDEDVPNLEGSLTSQLEAIASAHGGQVALQGRLFAQWLHYAFPRECPFPHKTGTVSTLSPSEFGQGYLVSEKDAKKHAAQLNSTDMAVDTLKEDLHWMSQWSTEEELVADYAALGLRAPWERSSGAFAVVGIAVLACLAVAVKVLCGGGVGRKGGAADNGFQPYTGKTHFV